MDAGMERDEQFQVLRRGVHLHYFWVQDGEFLGIGMKLEALNPSSLMRLT